MFSHKLPPVLQQLSYLNPSESQRYPTLICIYFSQNLVKNVCSLVDGSMGKSDLVMILV